MRKAILLCALLCSVSSSFISCREPEETDVDDMEMTDDMEEVHEESEEVMDGLEERDDAIKDKLDEGN